MDTQTPISSDFVDLLHAFVGTYKTGIQPKVANRLFECTRAARGTKIMAFLHNVLEHLDFLFCIFQHVVVEFIGVTQTIQLVYE